MNAYEYCLASPCESVWPGLYRYTYKYKIQTQIRNSIQSTWHVLPGPKKANAGNPCYARDILQYPFTFIVDSVEFYVDLLCWWPFFRCLRTFHVIVVCTPSQSASEKHIQEKSPQTFAHLVNFSTTKNVFIIEPVFCILYCVMFYEIRIAVICVQVIILFWSTLSPTHPHSHTAPLSWQCDPSTSAPRTSRNAHEFWARERGTQWCSCQNFQETPARMDFIK